MSNEKSDVREELSELREELSEVSYGVDQINDELFVLQEEITTLKECVRELERKQRYNRFVRKMWQRTVDELTVVVFEGDLARMLLFGEKLKQYEDELRELMGITRAELEAGDDDEAEDASEEEEVGADEL